MQVQCPERGHWDIYTTKRPPRIAAATGIHTQHEQATPTSRTSLRRRDFLSHQLHAALLGGALLGAAGLVSGLGGLGSGGVARDTSGAGGSGTSGRLSTTSGGRGASGSRATGGRSARARARAGRGTRTIVVGAVTVRSLVGIVGGVVDARVGPGDGAGGVVAGRGRVVEVDDDAVLGAVVDARDLDGGGRGAGAGSGDGQLGAADVELGAALLLGAVQGDVLAAHQVLARGEVLGQGEGEVVDAAADRGGPLQALGGDGRGRQLVHLEPVSGALVGGGVGALGRLGHVHGQGARVAEVRVDGEADRVARGDLLGLGLGHDVGVQAALVADEVLRGHIGDGRVRVGGLADERVGLRDLVVVDEGLKVVVGSSGGREGRNTSECGTHFGFLVRDCCLGGDEKSREMKLLLKVTR